MSFTNHEEPQCVQSAMLHSQQHHSGLILQICSLQHPQDPALPHEGSSRLLVQALVISCLIYCNLLLAGLPASAIKPLVHDLCSTYQNSPM